MTSCIAVDPRWAGIIEVLVDGLDGAVRWEPDSVVLQLPGRPGDDRDDDLDVLRLCLCLIAVPVVFDACRVTVPDASLVEFLRKLAESGLSVDIGSEAAWIQSDGTGPPPRHRELARGRFLTTLATRLAARPAPAGRESA